MSGDDAEMDGGPPSVNLDGSWKMRMLHTALCETMQLYPLVAWDSKHVAEVDVLPDGSHMEHCNFDRVTYFPYGMGRMEASYAW